MSGLGEPFRKYSEKVKKLKINVNAACEQKATSEKAKFCSTTLFQSTLKSEQKIFHAAKPPDCLLHLLFPPPVSHILNMCERSLEKTAPKYN